VLDHLGYKFHLNPLDPSYLPRRHAPFFMESGFLLINAMLSKKAGLDCVTVLGSGELLPKTIRL
jgi:hypothetical protein